jgi:long-chain acyl-CoA synthetase
MHFWNPIAESSSNPAFVLADSDQETITYRILDDLVDKISPVLTGTLTKKSLIFIFGEYALDVMLVYVASLRSGITVCFLPANLAKDFVDANINAYEPELILLRGELLAPIGYEVIEKFSTHQLLRRIDALSTNLHPELAILLSTSGSTGDVKMARISYTALSSNAVAIQRYLSIVPASRTITTLPIHYSYGLSIINSYLISGASIVVTEASLVDRKFWDTVSSELVTSFSGVPYTYEILFRFGFEKLPLKSVKVFTQAGGALSHRILGELIDYSEKIDASVYVMYGQTEASPRISYVPPDRLREKFGSIGIPIPSGSLSLAKDGEIAYAGPNVMMGYAYQRDDLAKGDELNGVLFTGDLGTQDSDGYFFLTGRKSRIVKLHGLRFNLDDIERKLLQGKACEIAALEKENRLQIFCSSPILKDSILSELHVKFRIHRSSVEFNVVDELPRLPSGKVNYAILRNG